MTAAVAMPVSSRYRIASRIASGGMGAVYIGIQRGAAGFERKVAIKRAHASMLEDPTARSMILAEARNASMVRHPNVVSVNDVEESKGELLLVMDYVEGASLSSLILRDQPLDPSLAARIGIDVCDGLAAIHGACEEDGTHLGLVHRDISPQNILVGIDGVARVTDFGISKSRRDARRTGMSARRGKLGYMAPEYIRSGTFSAQSDLFAVGVVLWETLTATKLNTAPTPLEAFENALEGIYRPAAEINPLVPPELDEVLARCLTVDMNVRYKTARELAAALESAVARVAERERVKLHVARIAGESIRTRRRAINAARRDAGPFQAAGEISTEYEIESADFLPSTQLLATPQPTPMPSWTPPPPVEMAPRESTVRMSVSLSEHPRFMPRFEIPKRVLPRLELCAVEDGDKEDEKLEIIEIGDEEFERPSLVTRLFLERSKLSVACGIGFLAILLATTVALVSLGASSDHVTTAPDGEQSP